MRQDARWGALLLSGIGPVLFFVAIGLLLFAAAMGRNLNHDEHQFLAPGALLAREGLQPYRDYPFFHLPNLVLVYAALDRVFSRPMLAARCFSVLCSFGTALLVFWQAWKAFPSQNAASRLAIAAGAVVFLVFDPLFSFTTGRSWNHDFPVFLTVLAVLLQVSAAERDSLWLTVASAVCAGLAAGTRLTYAPVLIPLWASVWFFPGPIPRRIAFATAYFAATTLALAPSLYYLFADREAFLFGNFEFPKLRLLDPDNDRIRKTINPLRKLRFFFKEVALPSLPLFLAFAAFAIQPAYRWVRFRPNEAFGAALVLGILPFALAGCFAPSRYQYQHFFVITPLLALGLAFAVREANWRRPRWIAIGVLAIICLTLGIYNYSKLLSSWHPANWFPNRVRKIGEQLREHTKSGRLLTLAPTYAVEAGVGIYPEFATAPFAWRSAKFVVPSRRDQLKLVAPDDLEGLLKADPPAAILTGVEERTLESPLVEYGRAHRFVPIKLGKERTLWLRPVSAQ